MSALYKLRAVPLICMAAMLQLKITCMYRGEFLCGANYYSVFHGHAGLCEKKNDDPPQHKHKELTDWRSDISMLLVRAKALTRLPIAY